MNGAEAARMAGYSKATAADQAYQLLHNPMVKAYLSERKSNLNQRLKISQEKLAKELWGVSFSRLTDFVSWSGNRIIVKSSDEIPDALQGAIQAIKPVFDKKGRPIGLELKCHEKTANARLLAQLLGWLHDRPREDNKGIIIEAMQALHAQAEKEKK
jgi:hypothetical protein